MSGPYSQTTHDGLNGDTSHFDADSLYNTDSNSFSNIDSALTTDAVESLNNTAAAASAHLSAASPDTYNSILAQESNDTGGEIQNLGVNDAFTRSAQSKVVKASRACDECRRRKSKCVNGNPENGQPCAPCLARGGEDAECHYNRAPMKRGPSKGYIQAMKGNVDDVSRGQRKVLSHVDDLKVELEMVKDQLSKLISFVQQKFGEDAIEPALSQDEILKRIRFSDTPMSDAQVLSLDGQKALSNYQAQFQSVLPLLPTDPLLLQTIFNEASESAQRAFELALRAIETPVYSSNVVDQARANLIGKSNRNLAKQPPNALYLATVGILMLAIQTTGPVSEYKGQLPNMLTLHEKAIGAFTALNPFEETSPRSLEASNYTRCAAIAIRSLLLITSIGSGEIFALIDQISVPGSEDAHLLGEPAYRFAQLAETFHEVFRSGVSSLTIDFDSLNLYDTNLPSGDYKIVALTLKLLTTRLNTFADQPNSTVIIKDLNDVVDSLYLLDTTAEKKPYAPSCWLYYHGLALAIKTAFDLLSINELDGTLTNQEATLATVNKLRQTINNLPVGALSGWEQSAMNTLNRFRLADRDDSFISKSKWRDLLAKDAYLRALDFNN